MHNREAEAQNIGQNHLETEINLTCLNERSQMSMPKSNGATKVGCSHGVNWVENHENGRQHFYKGK